MTAYIMCCGNISPYMSSVSQLIDEIITVSDKCVQSDVLVSEDDWMTLGFPHGWKYQKYAHGCPLSGYCVYLPEDYSSAADPVYLHLQDEIKQLQEKYPEGSGAYYDYYKDAVPICCVNDVRPSAIFARCSAMTRVPGSWRFLSMDSRLPFAMNFITRNGQPRHTPQS